MMIEDVLKQLGPKASIIVPCYNVEQYLCQCLDSLINHTLEEIEIICVNDGSTDSTLEILNKYARKDSRIIVVCQENHEEERARNNAIKRASSECIVFCDPKEPKTCEEILRERLTLDTDNNQERDNIMKLLRKLSKKQ